MNKRKRNFVEYIRRAKLMHNDKFDDSDLDKRMIRYHESGERIKLKAPWGEYVYGTVGITTGWKPSFLLLSNIRSISSSILLDNRFEIIGVRQENGKYKSV